jgi:hypothetical protein
MSFLAPLLLSAAGAVSCNATHLETHGFSRVDIAVIEEILPRALPACIEGDELVEFERRIWTLGLFDDVKIECASEALVVSVREKWTLIPLVDFSTSKSLEDGYVFASLIESNTLGRAMECGVYGAYYERAWSGEFWCGEHPFATRRPSFEINGQYVGSGFVYDDEPGVYAWERRRSGGRLGMRFPFPYESRFRFAVMPLGYHERSTGTWTEDDSGRWVGGLSPNLATEGFYGGVGLRVLRDAFEWHDLAPKGWRAGVEATPGFFFTESGTRGRHAVTAQVMGAARFSMRTGLIANLVGEAVNRGDPNHSFLLGSISQGRGSFGQIGGIRGLPDNRNRDAWHVFSNLELRHSIDITSRLFLQGAAFVDGGVYQRMNSAGHLLATEPALSGGAGIRLLPTFLAWAMLRLDGGRLFLPTEGWFVQLAFSQYL